MVKDIQKEAYELSSELFSFKDFRRGIIEHGKVCYIEGYKKHANLFYNFLIDNGYFTREELNRTLAEFDNFIEGTPIITIESAEDTFKKLRPWLPQDSYLTQVQKDVVDLYRMLSGDKHILIIQKPRQKGISTICEIITYIEAQNGKKILYAGYGQCDTAFKDLRNLTYVQLHSNETEIPIKYLINQRYDLIIVDEIISFRLPYETEKKLDGSLSENGRMIIIGTPIEPEWQNYKAVKDYFTSYNTSAVSKENRIIYTIHPEREDYEKAKKYPEYENEILGLWKK